MANKRLTCKQKQEQLLDEKAGIKWYAEHGFTVQAKDETRHLNFLKKQPCKR